MGAGFMSFERGSFPWTLNCDAVDIVLEGELEIRFGDESVIGRPGDIIFIPKGTSIFFSTPTRCKFVYVTYPVNWQAG
jgi:ethanolamine utilization protein EutQ